MHLELQQPGVKVAQPRAEALVGLHGWPHVGMHLVDKVQKNPEPHSKKKKNAQRTGNGDRCHLGKREHHHHRIGRGRNQHSGRFNHHFAPVQQGGLNTVFVQLFIFQQGNAAQLGGNAHAPFHDAAQGNLRRAPCDVAEEKIKGGEAHQKSKKGAEFQPVFRKLLQALKHRKYGKPLHDA